MPETVTTPAPAATPASAVQPPAVSPVGPVTAEQLIQRVSKEITTNPTETPPALELSDIGLSPDQIGKLPPELQTQWQQLKKNADAGLTKKFQALAEERKKAETLQQQLQSQQGWSRDRLREEMKKPDFIAAAQEEIAATQRGAAPSTWTGTTEEWSTLTDSEKTRWNKMEGTVNNLLMSQQSMLNSQEHDRVKQRFPDYDGTIVEQLQTSILDGKVSNETIKEWIWKAHNFDRYVEQSYKFGLQDRKGSLQEKITGSTTSSGLNISGNGAPTPKNEGERSRDYFVRIAKERLAQAKTGSQ